MDCGLFKVLLHGKLAENPTMNMFSLFCDARVSMLTQVENTDTSTGILMNFTVKKRLVIKKA